MLEEGKIQGNGYDLVESEGCGYIASDLSKPLTLDGRTKICLLKEDLNNARFIRPELLPTFKPNDVIPTVEMSVYAYSDDGFYREIGGADNSGSYLKQTKEALGITDYPAYTKVDGNNPVIAEMFKEQQELGYSIDDLKTDEAEVQITPYTIVYSTALSQEENEMLLTGYFGALQKELGELAYTTEIFNFISYHRDDLITCLKGKEHLIDFVKGQWDLGQEGIDDLVEDLSRYSPEEIVDGIDVRQGELDAIIGETAGILNEKNNEKENNGFSQAD